MMDIVVLDLETTSAVVTDARIVQYSMFRPLLPEDPVRTGLLNPGMPIPPASMAVHKITDEMVQNAPTFDDLANGMFAYLNDAFVCGYNAQAFDVEVLRFEFSRVGLDYKCPGVIDPFVFWHRKERHTLEAAYRRFCGQSLEDAAHDAQADAKAAWEVALATKEYFGGESWEEYIAVCNTPPEGFLDMDCKIKLNDGVPVLNFGKHKGTELRFVERSYREWLLTTNMSETVKKAIRETL
jgi:DNA polymerase III subunit epsilon